MLYCPRHSEVSPCTVAIRGMWSNSRSFPARVPLVSTLEILRLGKHVRVHDTPVTYPNREDSSTALQSLLKIVLAEVRIVPFQAVKSIPKLTEIETDIRS